MSGKASFWLLSGDGFFCVVQRRVIWFDVNTFIYNLQEFVTSIVKLRCMLVVACDGDEKKILNVNALFFTHDPLRL